MPNAPIAGPRRTPRPRVNVAEDTPTRVYLPPGPRGTLRPQPGPPEAAGPVTAPEPPATTEAQLPPLDYDDTSQRRGLALESTLESTRPGKRYRMQHFRWFALGVAFGALVAALWHGGASATCKAMRGWTACAIRSLEHRPTTTVAAVYPQPPATQPPAPCPANGSDLCRELLAPFDAAEVETVNVDDLPRTAPALDPTAATRATPSP